MNENETYTQGLGAEPDAEELKFQIEESPSERITVKVVGVGGCGCNIVDGMLQSPPSGVEFVTVNTDSQALKRCGASNKMLIGQRVTQGYGTGSDPAVGREAALESTDELTEQLRDADMVFLVAGLGGGTGTGAAPVVGSLAKQMGILTVAAAVKPFAFEGRRKATIAEEGFARLVAQVDTAIEIPNERVLERIKGEVGFFEAFRAANNMACSILHGISDILRKPGVMNSDFADIRAVFEDAGLAVVGQGDAEGRDAAVTAAKAALKSMDVGTGSLAASRKVLINITGSGQFQMRDTSSAINQLVREFDTDAQLMLGVVREESEEDRVRIMVVASGFDGSEGAAEDEVLIASADQDDGGALSLTQEDRYWEREAMPAAERRADPEPSGGSDLDDEADDPYAEYSSGSEPNEERFAETADPEVGAFQPLPTNGAPMEFIPPPSIREKSAEPEPETAGRGSIFRRHSLFR